MTQLFGRPPPPISFDSVDLGSKKISVPIARIAGAKPGATLLVTGGNDGDEYAGIAACYRVIEEFSHTPFHGNLIVIPIVNIPGFEGETSKNPLDGKYPKLVYPGNKNGSSSERLRWWVSGIAHTTDFWIDLHGGSLTERITPFAQSWRSGDSIIDEKVFSVLKRMPFQYGAFMKDIFPGPAMMSKHGCAYMVIESGAFGNYSEESILAHISAVHVLMDCLGMKKKISSADGVTIFQRIIEYTVRKEGIWYARFPKNARVESQVLLGEVYSLEGKRIEKVYAKEAGILLWGKEGMRANKGDIVAGVGYDEIT